MVPSTFEKARAATGMSTAELARRVNMDKKRLWYVLREQREMRVEEFLKLCVALRIDPRSFVTREIADDVAKASARSIGRAQH